MKKINWRVVSASTLCILLLAGGLTWNHQWMKKYYEKRQKAYVSFSQRFPNDGSLPFGSLLVLRDRHIVVVVKEGFRKDFSEVSFLGDEIIGDVQEYYPPNVTGQKMKERRFILDQFIQGKTLEVNWRRQVE